MYSKHAPRAQKHNINNRNKYHERETHCQKKIKPNSKRYLNYDENADRFRAQLRTIGLELRDIAGDGNCLFRSFADQMDGDARNHALYRKQVCDYILKNQEDYQPFIVDQPFDVFLKSLAEEGTYAGNESIVAFAQLYNAKICVHQLHQPIWVVCFSNKPEYELHISYHNFEHYSSVRKIGDLTVATADVRLQPVTTTKSATTSNCTSFSNKSKKEEASNEYLIDEHDISYIISQTNTNDKNLIHHTLSDFSGDIDSTIAYLLAITTTDNLTSNTCAEKLQRIMSITGVYDIDLVEQSYRANNSDVNLTIGSLSALAVDNAVTKTDDSEYNDIQDETPTFSSSVSKKSNVNSNRQTGAQNKKAKKKRAMERRRAETEKQQTNDKNRNSSASVIDNNTSKTNQDAANAVVQPNPNVNIEFIRI
ncbi:unnamed protein product [Didymodactylos carnosus]|uniref:OTU domain-containing protein n=1 Tax=Didymodactylos carnosus TaxID=1234261 RepID=A0A813PAL6_9BILA|nr:unnamed protein product [Didymodactylos carnosus]CAF0750007.1 unnamed protein product [Didymodactylos carnosus]CAF3505380.1 unnamed protein product [Didymodactylos carnosus]CAF3529369.1 unnamed protein product [Didymodactylos carnosus]